MRRASLLALLFLAACPAEDEDLLDAGVAECTTTRDDWRADLGVLDRSCDQASECALAGGIPGLPCTLPYRPSIGASCGGTPVRASAYAASDLASRAAAWDSACGATCEPWGCVADCAPSRFDCVNHVCTVTRQQSCLPSPDAGP